MNLETNIYELADIPEHIVDFIQTDHSILSNILNLPSYIDEANNIESFHENFDQYPPLSQLPNDIIERTNAYTISISNETIDVDRLYNKAIIDATEIEDLKIIDKIFRVRPLLGEQIGYFEIDDPQCKIFYIMASINHQYYGGIFVFWNEQRPDIIFIQGITKFLVPSLVSILAPEYDKILPRLNTVLSAAIETCAKMLGADKIMTVPIGRQGSILEKHYGYKKTDTVYYPCDDIMGKNNVLFNLDHYEVYVKYL